MNNLTKSTKPLFALMFSLLLLGGTHTTALAQDGSEDAKPPTEMNDMDMGSMMEMMKNCPMMKDNPEMAQMMKECPMMKDGATENGTAMGDMMKNCPMMQKMMATMMENCPMMKGQMQGEMMQHDGTMEHEDGRGEASTRAHHGESAQRMSVRPASEAGGFRVQGDVQVVKVTIGESGYEPKQIALEAGTPARLVFTRTTDGTCAKQIQIPAFGIEKTDLPLNEPVTFEVTPEEAGTFTFACGMDMMKGTIVVKS